jgi:CubicO group peptidase (beta-lactamase class C family)
MLSRRQAILGISASALAPRVSFAAEPNLLQQAMIDTAVPGMAAMVIRNFRAEREIVAGVRRMGAAAPIRRGDRWHLGSDGKAMTATLIARLVERGVLSWETPLEQMAPDLASVMRAEYRDVTLPDLLSHRSGLPENPRDIDFLITFVRDPTPLPQQRTRYITAALDEPPAVAKRADPSYSNTGFILAGAIAERATGQAYETLMRDELFRPLRMRSVTYESYDQREGPDEPIGHTSGRIADQLYDPNPPVMAPSDCGFRLSLRDWSRFCIDQMRGEHGAGRLLRAETYRYLHARQGDKVFALGWEARPRIFGRRGPVINHSGSNGNWMAWAVLFPEIGDGVLVVANSAYGMDGNTVSELVLRQFVQTLSEPAPT